jgi:dihydroorotate dehydrogenase
VPVIATGGVMTKNDAENKIQAGAKLVQLYTGFIYSGPPLIKEIAGMNRIKPRA